MERDLILAVLPALACPLPEVLDAAARRGTTACVTGRLHTSDVGAVVARLEEAHAAGRGIRPEDSLIVELVELIDHLTAPQRDRTFTLIG
jgi:hypothetical protein